MNIQAAKLELMKLILETNNPSIIESISKLLKKEFTADFWETLPEEQKEEIIQGIAEIENGEIVGYDDFMKKHR